MVNVGDVSSERVVELESALAKANLDADAQQQKLQQELDKLKQVS